MVVVRGLWFSNFAEKVFRAQCVLNDLLQGCLRVAPTSRTSRASPVLRILDLVPNRGGPPQAALP